MISQLAYLFPFVREPANFNNKRVLYSWTVVLWEKREDRRVSHIAMTVLAGGLRKVMTCVYGRENSTIFLK